jgi:hypothetical protein
MMVTGLGRGLQRGMGRDSCGAMVALLGIGECERDGRNAIDWGAGAAYHLLRGQREALTLYVHRPGDAPWGRCAASIR